MMYKLTENTKEAFGETLYQIELTEDCEYGKAGTLGGYIQGVNNLRQNAWVFEDAIVCENAIVSGNARVSGEERAYDNTLYLKNYTKISDYRGESVVYSYVSVDRPRVSGNVVVRGNARIYGDNLVYGNAEIYDDASIFGNAIICDNAKVFGKAWIFGNATIKDDARISGDARIHGKAKVSGTFETTPLQIQGTKGFFNISKKDEIDIGCYVHSIDYWLENYEDLTRLAGYTESQVKEYKAYIDLAKLLSSIN